MSDPFHVASLIEIDSLRILRALWREAERALNRVSPFAPIVTLNMDREARAAVERYFLPLEHVLGNFVEQHD